MVGLEKECEVLTVSNLLEVTLKASGVPLVDHAGVTLRFLGILRVPLLDLFLHHVNKGLLYKRRRDFNVK
jgi:hypothetical protein